MMNVDDGGEWLQELMDAAQFGRVNMLKDVIQYILKDGTMDMLNHKDGFNRTAMHVAAFRGHADCVEALLAAGARSDIPNGLGDLPLHRSIEQGHVQCVERLTRLGSMDQYDHSNDKGQTPLDLALEKGKKKVVEMVRRAGEAQSGGGGGGSAVNEHDSSVLSSASVSSQSEEKRMALFHKRLVDETAKVKQLTLELKENDAKWRMTTRMLEDQIKELEGNADELREENQQLRADLSKKRTISESISSQHESVRLKREYAELQEFVDKLEQKLEDEKGRNAKLESQLKQTKENGGDGPVALVEKEWAQALTRTCEQLEDELRSCNKQLQKSRDMVVQYEKVNLEQVNRGRPMNQVELEDEIRAVRVEREDARRERDELKGRIVELQRLQRQVDELEKEQERSISQRDEAREQLDTCRMELTSLREQLAEANKELDASKTQLLRQQAQREGARAVERDELRKAKADRESLRKEKEALVEERDMARKESDELSEKYRLLSGDLEALKAERDQTMSTVTELTTELARRMASEPQLRKSSNVPSPTHSSNGDRSGAAVLSPRTVAKGKLASARGTDVDAELVESQLHAKNLGQSLNKWKIHAQTMEHQLHVATGKLKSAMSTPNGSPRASMQSLPDSVMQSFNSQPSPISNRSYSPQNDSSQQQGFSNGNGNSSMHPSEAERKVHLLEQELHLARKTLALHGMSGGLLQDNAIRSKLKDAYTARQSAMGVIQSSPASSHQPVQLPPRFDPRMTPTSVGSSKGSYSSVLDFEEQVLNPRAGTEVAERECRGCRAEFNLIRRRHFCRGCSQTFCGSCTSHRCKLSGYPNPCRVCDGCFLRESKIDSAAVNR